MKKTPDSRSAFFNLRSVSALLLCVAGVILALFASGAVRVGDNSPSKKFAGGSGENTVRGGGGAPLSNSPAEPRQAAAQSQADAAYNGPQHDTRPVNAVRSGELRDVKPIHPSKAPKHDHPEPIRPAPPSQNGGIDGPLQAAQGQQFSAPAPVGAGFDGVGTGTGGFVPSSNPPDVNGRVGATQFVQWNNSSFAIFDKTTGALQYGPAAGNTLFQALGGVCASHNDGDPVVSYDILAGRWVLSQFVVGGPTGSYSHQCVAVSTTSDATGAYYLYDFLTDGTNFVDYPHTGIWPDGYYMSAHVFNAAGTSYLAGRVYVFERDKMIAGLPARKLQADLAHDGSGIQYGFLPADLDSLTPPPVGEAAFVLGPNAQFTNRTDSTRVKVTWGTTPTIALTSAVISTSGISTPPCVNNTTAQQNRDCVPQPAPAVGADYLDNLSGHFMYRLAYRNNGTQAAPQESLVATAPVPGSASTPAHGAVKWWEFRNAGSSTTTPTVFQSGTFDPDSGYRFMSSIAMDKDRNIALGYSKSSTTVKPGIYMTGRLATDAAGTMGAETTVQLGLGVQTTGAGNRWGDYTAMTLDPIDQCTFYYTNEYLKTNGAFNWSTRIATYKFPSCSSAAAAYGTVTGTISSTVTGAPISGVTVTLSNGYAGASDANGVYTITVPAGSYTATAAGTDRNCATAAPASASVAPQGGGTVTQNFTMDGASKVEANGVTIDDSTGNSNGIVNKAECVKLNVGLKNNGCAAETAISATLTTSTAGVTVVDSSASYPDMPIDGTGANSVPFRISTSDTFACGTDIALSLNVTYASGNKTIALTVPSCAGGANQAIPGSSLTTTDLTQADRLGRDGVPSTCSGKVSPGGGFAGTKYYKKFTFTNTSGAPRCFTVTINAALGGAGDIESAAYDQTYDPANLSTNYLGDSGISGLGTTVGNATYSFTVPALHNFIVVVNTTGTTTSSQFSGTVSGFVDNTAGPGACSGNPSPTPAPTPTPTPVPTPTPTPSPVPTPTPTPSPVPTPTPTPSPVPTPTPSPTPVPTPTPTPSPTPAPDFSLAISPSSATIAHNGGTATYTVTITRSGGFSSGLTMSVSGLPAGATGSFAPNPATGSTTTLTVTAPGSVAKGTYSLVVTGSGGSPVITHSANATLLKK
ncbi:MAG: hypothetical protein QOD67_1970 [Caballeronia sp.]|nr:hypothetical protein [Caballeronia sp.]